MESDDKMREALKTVIDTLEPFDEDTQNRILKTVEVFFDLSQ